MCDLLPLYDYLQNQATPPLPTPFRQMCERNLLGNLLLALAGLAQLLARTPLTTIAGTGFTTLESIVVSNPPASAENPPRFADGMPAGTQTTSAGDGTVLLGSAVADHTKSA